LFNALIVNVNAPNDGHGNIVIDMSGNINRDHDSPTALTTAPKDVENQPPSNDSNTTTKHQMKTPRAAKKPRGSVAKT